MLAKECRSHLLLNGKPNIVRSHGFGKRCEEDNFLLLDLCESSLAEEIAKRKTVGSFFSEEELLVIIKDIARGLMHMHETKLVHCDIKPENILIRAGTSGIEYVIGDLGNTLHADSGHDIEPGDGKYHAHDFQLGFSAKLLSFDILSKVDIFSLGATVLAAASLQDLPEGGQAWIDLRKEGPKPFERYSPRFNTLLRKMMLYEATDRHSSESLMKELEVVSL